MILPSYVESVLEKLEQSGFEAYVVGGAVRDFLLGKAPSDYDIATSARPGDVKLVFGYTIDTGLKHGTVTVLSESKPIEVTTFRCDGIYQDKRHPLDVKFVSSVLSDLARRDFTVNAIAFNKKGFVDPFGGQDDIKNKIIRTVGNPESRFREDALRILRCLRFSAQLDFVIEKATYEACKLLSYTLCEISKERILSELNKTFACCRGMHLLLMEETGIFKTALPLPESLSSDKINRFEQCKTLTARWVTLLEEKTSGALESLRSSRRERCAAKEIEEYDKKKHKYIYAAYLKHATTDEFFDYLHDSEGLDYFKSSCIPKRLKELNIKGADLAQMGFTGEEIGKAMRALYEHAVLNPRDNSKERLKERALWLKENLPKV